MGVVRVATRKSDGCKFALKTIPKAGPQSLSGQTPTGEAMSIWERKVRDEVSLHFALGASLDSCTKPGDPYFNKLTRILATRSMQQARRSRSNRRRHPTALC